jgi:hypothetical protein
MYRLIRTLGSKDRGSALKAHVASTATASIDLDDMATCVAMCALKDRADVIRSFVQAGSGRVEKLCRTAGVERLIGSCALKDRSGLITLLVQSNAAAVAARFTQLLGVCAPQDRAKVANWMLQLGAAEVARHCSLVQIVGSCALRDRARVCIVATLAHEALRQQVRDQCISVCAPQDRSSVLTHVMRAEPRAPSSSSSSSSSAPVPADVKSDRKAQCGGHETPSRMTFAARNDNSSSGSSSGGGGAPDRFYPQVDCEAAPNRDELKVKNPSDSGASGGGVGASSDKDGSSKDTSLPRVNRMGLKESPLTDRDDEACLVCTERERNVLSFPCGHRTHCLACDPTVTIRLCMRCHEPMTAFYVVQ